MADVNVHSTVLIWWAFCFTVLIKLPVLFSLKYIHPRDGASHCSGATLHLAACFSLEIWLDCVTLGEKSH